MKLVEWNIHKMARKIPVKQFVIDTLMGVDADIICLVEYWDDDGIRKSLEDRYWFEESNTVSGNKVLIAVKRELALDEIKVRNKDEEAGCYNFLHIDFVMPNGEPLSVMGVRMLSPMDAETQTPPLKDYISKLKTPFICAGDFNIKSDRMSKWFPNIQTEKLVDTDNKLYNSSIMYIGYNHKVSGFGAVDHVLHSNNIDVQSEYDWKFLSSNPVYPCIDEIDIGTHWSIPPAYPDHALMISNIEVT